MSADVYIAKEGFNYTHNLAPLWYNHILDTGKGGGLNEIDGVTGRRAAEILSLAIASIDNERVSLWNSAQIGEPILSNKYDAKNGWGSLVGGILFLSKIMSACYQHPRSVVRVSL